MRHGCISAMMAVVLVVTGAGSARAQEADVPQRLDFTMTPAMARALTLQQSAQISTTSHKPGSSKVKAAVAFGLIGMLGGAAIGSHATKDCGCDGGPGGYYGVLIGTPLGAWFGVWLAGR